MEKKIKISIITATLNSADTLSDCLNSVVQQDYFNKEHIIIDGASTDDTVTILQKYIEQISIINSEPDHGIYDALNKGLALATGDVVGFLHADDFYASPNVLSSIAKIFNENPTVSAVYGDLKYVSQSNTFNCVRFWRSSPFNKFSLSMGWMPAHPTLYVRRKWYSDIGGFDTSYRISADYLSILKLFSNPNFNAILIRKVFVIMRLGGTSNKTFKTILIKSKEDWRALRTSGWSVHKSIWTLLWKNISKIRQFL